MVGTWRALQWASIIHGNGRRCEDTLQHLHRGNIDPPLGAVSAVGLRGDQSRAAYKVQQPPSSRAEDVPAITWHGREARGREGLALLWFRV